MSVAALHNGPPIAFDGHASSSTGRFTADIPVTIEDLLDILRNNPPRTFAMIRTTCGLLSACFGEQPPQLEISRIANAMPEFRAFLDLRRYRRNSIRLYLHYTRIMLRVAETHGWSGRPTLSPMWRDVYQRSKERRCARLALHLSHLRKDPRDVTIEDVEEWGQQRVRDGIHFASQQKSARRFWKILQQLNCLGVDRAAVIGEKTFGVPLRDFPAPLKSEVEELLAWKQASFAVDRPKKAQIRPVTADAVRKLISRLYGYTGIAGIHGINSLESLVTKEILGGYISFSLNERKIKGWSVASPLSSLLAAMRQHPRYKGEDWRWFQDIIAAIPIESGNERKSRKGQKFLDFDKLSSIPAKMHAARSAAAKKGPRALAIHATAELLAQWLLILPWRQRNLRECRIGGERPNLYKGRPPIFSEIERPGWVQHEEQANPAAEFWLLRFGRDETKTKNEPQTSAAARAEGPIAGVGETSLQSSH